MKTKKWLIFVCAAAFIAGSLSCGGGGKYGDVKKMLTNSNKVLEAFIEDMGKADSAEQVANILTDFNKAMGKLMPEMRLLEEKYPELLKGQEIPPELGEAGQKSMELWTQFPNALQQVQQYAENEKVQKAMDELQNILN